MSNQEGTTAAQLREQAENLLKEAAQLERVERERHVREVGALIVRYGLTKEELFPEKRGRGRPSTTAKTPKTPAYYLNPKTGETAQRQGKKPQWLTELIASGAPKETYIIELGAVFKGTPKSA